MCEVLRKKNDNMLSWEHDNVIMITCYNFFPENSHRRFFFIVFLSWRNSTTLLYIMFVNLFCFLYVDIVVTIRNMLSKCCWEKSRDRARAVKIYRRVRLPVQLKLLDNKYGGNKDQRHIYSHDKIVLASKKSAKTASSYTVYDM
jgi:hypothetical protein